MRADILEQKGEIEDILRLANPWAEAHPLGIQMEFWWLSSYLHTLARKPFAIALRDGNDLVAAGFFEKRARSLGMRGVLKKRVITFLAQGPSDFSDVLLAPGVHPGAVGRIVMKNLLAIKHADEIALEQLPEVSAPAPEMARAARSRLLEWVRVYTVSLTEGYEALWKTRGRNLRRDITKKRRKLQRELRVETSVLRSAPEDLLEEITALNLRRTGHRSPFTDKRQVFVKRMLASAEVAGRLLIFLMRAGGKLVSYRLGFLREGVFFDWNTSFDPEFFPFSVGKIHLANALAWCAENGIREFNFMRGDEEYKRAWTADFSVNKALVVKRPTLRTRAARLWSRIRPSKRRPGE